MAYASFAAMPGPPAVMPPRAVQGADRGPGVFGALEEHLRRAPEDPALFHPDGLDVRWRSWRSLADQAAAGAERLSAAGVPPGRRVAFRWRCDPDAVAADLAVQWTGGVAVPVADAAEAAAAECVARVVLPGEEGVAWEPLAGVPAVTLPEAEEPRHRGSPAARWPAPSDGGARVLEPAPDAGTPAVARDFSPAEIAEAARRLGVRLERSAVEADAAAGGRGREGREIALVHLDLRRADGRALLSWGLLSGAALFLEPDSRAVAASAAWARPTLVAAEAAPLVELARQLRRREESRLRRLLRRGRPRHPFGRLRLLVVLGGGRLPVDDVPFWAERGVVVLRG